MFPHLSHAMNFYELYGKLIDQAIIALFNVTKLAEFLKYYFLIPLSHCEVSCNSVFATSSP